MKAQHVLMITMKTSDQLDLCACRQELSALREKFVRQQAEEEAYHAQEVRVRPFCLLEAGVLQQIQTF